MTPELVESNAGVIARVREARASGKSVGLVPTMGALHDGHAELLRTARRGTDFVVASIFVNPLQFDRADDLARYPRTLDGDLRVCGECGTDLVYFPSPEQLYPREQLAFVELPKLSETLCGAFRPGHFRGVATVVLKLFNIVQPDRAYFGEKDAQQLAIIRRMVRDLNVPVEVVAVPTVRESDGLALSSRNKHLSQQERATAVVLSRALRLAEDMLRSGTLSVAEIREKAGDLLRQYPEVRLEYFEIVNPETLIPVAQVNGRVLIAGAIWVGKTRLIDNLSATPSPVVR